MKLPEAWTENCADLLRAFNKEGVEYLIFGSMAKSHYDRSVARVSDMDVLLNPTPENAIKVKSVLDFVVFRIDGSTARCTAEGLAKPRKQACPVRDKHDLNVDFLTARRDFNFYEAFSRSIAVDVVDGIPARIVSKGDQKILDSYRPQRLDPTF